MLRLIILTYNGIHFEDGKEENRWHRYVSSDANGAIKDIKVQLLLKDRIFGSDNITAILTSGRIK